MGPLQEIIATTTLGQFKKDSVFMKTAVTSNAVIPMPKCYKNSFRNMNAIMDHMDGLRKKFFCQKEVPQSDKCMMQHFLWKLHMLITEKQIAV